jgi:hypothetical protein
VPPMCIIFQSCKAGVFLNLKQTNLGSSLAVGLLEENTMYKLSTQVNGQEVGCWPRTTASEIHNASLCCTKITVPWPLRSCFKKKHDQGAGSSPCSADT